MNTTVTATTGTYIGHKLENGVIEFLGIPYAQPPKRWQKAQPLKASKEIFEAAECGPACWQEVQKEEWVTAPPMSEDCLTLNIWTADPQKKGKPVLVWIHGGCYATGSNRKDCYNGVYCGDQFVAESPDIVYVNINYRINIFGSLDLSRFDQEGIYADSTNLQTLDQIAALQWIHENIQAFGGDPQQVTISGQSAGGMSVASLMAIPEARPYFQKVICQSTACSDAFLKTKEDARMLADRFYQIAGAQSLEDLLKMPADQLCQAGQELAKGLGTGDAGAFEQVWGQGIFPENPCQELREGKAADIPLMIGTVAGEFDTVGFYMTEEEICQAAAGVFPQALTPDLIEEFVSHDPKRDRKTAYQDLWNDALLRLGAVVTANAQTQGGGKAYLYYISFLPQGAKIRPQHCFEIPYTNMKKDHLVYMDLQTGEPVQGNQPCGKLEKELHGCWANFVRNGNPNGNHIDVEWPLYTPEKRLTAVIDHAWSIEVGVRNQDTDLLLPLHLKQKTTGAEK